MRRAAPLTVAGGLKIARIFGIPIYLHPTWLVVFLLLTLGLSQAPELASLGGRSFAIGAVTSLLFFASILLHELGHTVLALRHGVPVRSITLFFLGGVALMEKDADTPLAEFQIAIAGPIVSGLLALLFAGLLRVTPADSPEAFVAGYLRWVNLLVAGFNLLPGLPLDGGRVLRAFLWARSGSLSQATQSAATGGRTIGYALMALGGLQILGVLPGGFLGIWQLFIGWFLFATAGAMARQLHLDDALRGMAVGDIMSSETARIDADTPVETFAREWVMRGRRWALVERSGQVLGLVSLSDVKRVDPDAWATTPVTDVATPAARLLTAEPETPLRDILLAMGQRDVNQIPVLEAGRVVGAVTREHVLHVLELVGRRA